MNKPLVSIIIAVYNEEKNIKRLLKSINTQTYKGIESIVVDDGSTDDTVKVAKKYATKVFAQKHAERSVQRNFGVDKSSGKYVLILDGDMELTPKVIDNCVKIITSSKQKALIIPEKTIGEGFLSKIRNFERSMYMGDPTIEVARFFEKKVFLEFGGYDKNLTGAEDYDLPYRISSKYEIGWAKEWIFHHEAQRTLLAQLKRKYYYAKSSAIYAQKHPELVATQGNMLFRKAYLRHWYKFFQHPLLGVSFVTIRVFETSAAVLGFISAVGVVEFTKTFVRMFK